MSLVVAAKHSKDLSATEDKFRERTALYLRHAGIPGMEMLEKTGGWGRGGGGFLTIVSAHSQTQEASPSPTATTFSFPKS